MNWIQVFIQIAVSILLLEFAGASPVGSVSVRSAHGHLTNSSSSSVCDTTHPYCCKPPLTALSLSQLYDELNIVIDLVDPACTDKAFRKNLRGRPFTLDKTNEDKQNDFLNGAFELHMAIEERKKALCKAEEKKFYRGEKSMVEKCNLGCAITNVEKQIVTYLQANKCGCKKNGKIDCHYLAKPRNEDIECFGNCDSLTIVNCKLWESLLFMQEIISEINTVRQNS